MPHEKMKVDIETLNRVISANPDEYDEQAAELLIIVKLYAADLLDARATIEKQSALIKEIRAFIHNSYFDITTEDRMAKALLERTKDFT